MSIYYDTVSFDLPISYISIINSTEGLENFYKEIAPHDIEDIDFDKVNENKVITFFFQKPLEEKPGKAPTLSKVVFHEHKWIVDKKLFE